MNMYLIVLRVFRNVAVPLCLLGTAFSQQSPGSPLTLPQAVSIALEKNPLRKAAIADTKAASADTRVARSFLMPHLSFSEVAARGNDPIYVFGSKLRQQRFTAADFALNELNTPLPFGNFTTRFGGTWKLFDSFADWHGVRRAKQMEEAAGHQLDRTDQEIIFRVVSTYYDVLLAARQLEVSEQAMKTAQAILESSQGRFDSGLAVESDVLTAKVRMAGRQQEAIQARNHLEVVRAQLNTAMGVPVETAYHPVEALEGRALLLPEVQELERQAIKNRSDLKRIASEEAAQFQSVAIAESSFGPRLNAFAGWEMDNPTFKARGGGNNWLGGVELQFDIFQGGAKRAQLARQRALAEKASAMKQAAGDSARLEVRQAYYQTDASRQQVEVARTAIALARESLRINQDRFDTGLSTITDLLAAEEADLRSQSDYWEAVYRFQTSYAKLELACGTLNPQSPVVMP